MPPATTVYTVTDGSSKRHFIVRAGQPVECASMEEGFDHRGQWCRVHRYSLCWTAFPLYQPSCYEHLSVVVARDSLNEHKAEAGAARGT